MARSSQLYRSSLSALLILIGTFNLLSGCSSKTRDIIDPEPFSFEQQQQVDYDAWIVSESVTVNGITAPAPVQISNGEFSIDDGTFASTDATVTDGQTIRVRVRSPEKADETIEAALTIGGYTTSFRVTTAPDTTPPEVSILFPPPASMTEGESVFIRGTTEDRQGTLATIHVNEVEAEFTLNDAGDQADWQATVPLDEGDNTVTVVVEDAAGNVNDLESVAVRRAAITSAFPDNEAPFVMPIGVDFFLEEDGGVAYVTDPMAQTVFSIDMRTGVRSVLSSNDTQDDLPFNYPWGVTLAGESRLAVSDWDEGAIYSINTSSQIREVITDGSLSEVVRAPRGITYHVDDTEEKLIVTDGSASIGSFIYSVDLNTRETEIMVDSSYLTTEGDHIKSTADVAIDLTGNTLFIVDREARPNSIFTFDLQNRTLSRAHSDEQIAGFSYITVDYNSGKLVFSNSIITPRQVMFLWDLTTAEPRLEIANALQEENPLDSPWGIATHPDASFALLTDAQLQAVFAIDLNSGFRVIVSKSETD